MENIVIQGWRFIPHSYSIVNQFQCLELMKRNNIQIFHEDMPFLKKNLLVNNLFEIDAETSLRAIQKTPVDCPVDAVLRITCPYNLEPSFTPKTCVFGTAEAGVVTDNMLVGSSSLKEAHSHSESIIITPSSWSRSGFIQSGADPSRVVVIPHGVDPSMYKPIDTHERNKLRSELGWEGFIFLHIGAMTSNKGIHLLLKAFASVVDKHPEAKLVLKGIDSLYPSEEFLLNAIEDLTLPEAESILPNLVYIGETLSFSKVAQLYQAADVYVSPYFAEAFNMPVLEAIACGLPVICTKGGPTDDFTTQDFALHIESYHQEFMLNQYTKGYMLVPEIEHLIELMATVIQNQSFINLACNAGPKFVVSRFTWQAVVDQLLTVLLGGSS